MQRKFAKCVGAVAMAAALTLSGCAGGSSDKQSQAGGSGGTVTLEFAQWWEPELPSGSFRALMDKFEAANPGIKVKLISGPYASTKEQIVSGAAAGTMPDVVGLDGAWVNDFVKQGSLANLSDLMKKNSYDESQLVKEIKVNGNTYMLPVANFVYPMFINNATLTDAGGKVPTTQSEFAATAKKMTSGSKTGWVLPLDQGTPNGIQNDVMSWVWASGGSMLKDGKPNLAGNAQVEQTMTFIKGMYDGGAIAKGSFTMKEQDKVNEFTNGRVGMMIDSLAHVNLIRKQNPDLKFTLAALPKADGYSGKSALPYASWGIGVSAKSKHATEAFKLVSFLFDKDNNSKLCTDAHAFPGNKQSTPGFLGEDPAFQQAFDIYKQGDLANEFVALPVAEDLMRSFDIEFQKYLDGKQSSADALKNAQAAWDKSFKG